MSTGNTDAVPVMLRLLIQYVYYYWHYQANGIQD